MTFLIVLVRLLTATFSNVVQKQLTNTGQDPVLVVLATYFLMAVGASPFLLIFSVPEINDSFWYWILAAGALDALGNFFLVHSLRLTDLSIFGPLNAFKSVIAMGFAFLMLHEVPTTTGAFGVAIIVMGSYLLAPQARGMGFRNFVALFAQKGVWFRFLSLGLFSLGAVYLKKAVVLRGTFDAYYWWVIIGLFLSAIWYLPWCRIRQISPAAEANNLWPDHRLCIALAILIATMQLSTLWVFREMLVGYALALFQISMVLQVFLGRLYFKEPDTLRRLSASIIMLAGALLILLANTTNM